jgi:hypothetical protein
MKGTRQGSFFPSNFVLSKFQKNVIRKNVQSRPPFKRTSFFDQNEFWKNNRQILKEPYSIKQPILVILPEVIIWCLSFDVALQKVINLNKCFPSVIFVCNVFVLQSLKESFIFSFNMSWYQTREQTNDTYIIIPFSMNWIKNMEIFFQKCHPI